MTAPPDNSSLYRSAQGYHKVLAHYDTALQETQVPCETRYVQTRFGPTHTVISGDEGGKPLVLWHGLNANATNWLSWFPALAPTYRVYAIDTIGGMGKSAASRPSNKGPAYGEWAAEVLEGLGLKRANMIGASNGGWLVVKLGSVAPDMISCAVLMSSAGLTPLSKMQVFKVLPRIIFKPPAEMARGLLEMLSPPDSPPDPYFLAFLELMIASGFRSKKTPPVIGDAEIRRLAAPTYLLMGQYEVSFNPYKAIERGLRLLPNVISAEIVPGVGHSMTHSQPDWVPARLIRFLKRYTV